jgi:copper chaperone
LALSPENAETLVFQVEGMSCTHCKISVENAVQALNGVTGARVNLAENKVEITYDPAGIKREELENAIKQAGYKVIG